MAPTHASTLAQEIGRRIQALRAEQGISLSELARGAQLGKATLSTVEAGTRNPTLETLYAIAARLDVPLAALLAPPAVRTAPEPVHGAAVTAHLLEVFTDAGISTELYRLTIRPGLIQTSPAHPHGVVEYLTVFSGTAVVGPVRAPSTVSAGGHVSFDADTPHIYQAVGGEVHASLLIRHPGRSGGSGRSGRPGPAGAHGTAG